MKRKTKSVKIISYLVILALAFLFSFNVVYAYFTAEASLNGSLNFYDLNVKFCFNSTTAVTTETDGSVNVTLANSISRGGSSLLKQGSVTINSVGFQANTSSCAYYVRFWLDVNIVGNTSVNYGKYFSVGHVDEDDEFYESDDLIYATTTNNANNVYYVKNAIDPSQVLQKYCFSVIHLSKDADASILDQNITIKISFDSVQANNNACVAEFGSDIYGYYLGWVND